MLFVNTHPVTGARALYLDPETSIGIEGLPPQEGLDLLETLRSMATRPEFVYKHKWQVGDAVLWDNGVMLHRRDGYDSKQRRFHKRTTIALPAAKHIVPQGRLYEQ